MSFSFTQTDLPTSSDTAVLDPVDMVNGGPAKQTSVDPMDEVFADKTETVEQKTTAHQPEQTSDSTPATSAQPENLPQEFDEADREYNEALDKYYDELLSWEADCERRKAEHAQHYIELKENLAVAALEVSARQSALKASKSKHKAIVEELEEMNANGPELAEKPKKPTKPKLTKSADGSQIKIFRPATEENKDAWRMIPSEQVITKDIERLGKKKRQAIIDLYKTLGELEDLRGEASKQHRHFCQLLPAGIGETVADRIAEKMMDAVAKAPFGSDSVDV